MESPSADEKDNAESAQNPASANTAASETQPAVNKKTLDKQGEVSNSEENAGEQRDKTRRPESTANTAHSSLNQQNLNEQKQRNVSYFNRLANDYVEAVNIKSKLQLHAANTMIDTASEIRSDPVEYFKKTFGGDVPRFTQNTVDWVRKIQQEIKQVESIFDSNQILTLSTIMAVCEERNRRDRIANNISDLAQDKYVEHIGSIKSFGVLDPHIGPGNINYDTARDLKNRFEELPNLDMQDMQELKRMIYGTEAELSRYILTAKGTFMIGHSLMYLIEKDIAKYNLFPEEMTREDKLQNLVDIWRQGNSRINKMIDNKANTEKNERTYYPKHKHDDSNITIKNLHDIYPIIYPSE